MLIEPFGELMVGVAGGEPGRRGEGGLDFETGGKEGWVGRSGCDGIAQGVEQDPIFGAGGGEEDQVLGNGLDGRRGGVGVPGNPAAQSALRI